MHIQLTSHEVNMIEVSLSYEQAIVLVLLFISMSLHLFVTWKLLIKKQQTDTVLIVFVLTVIGFVLGTGYFR
jgi:hypothetical protein